MKPKKRNNPGNAKPEVLQYFRGQIISKKWLDPTVCIAAYSMAEAIRICSEAELVLTYSEIKRWEKTWPAETRKLLQATTPIIWIEREKVFVRVWPKVALTPEQCVELDRVMEEVDALAAEDKKHEAHRREA